MGPDHSHSHEATSVGSRRERRLATAIALNVFIVVAQVIAGVAAGSLGLLADAAHNMTDVLALVVSLVAIRLSQRAYTERHSFGFHRATVLAALFNAASVLAVSGYVLVEAVQRLRNPEPVDGGIVVAFAILGVVCNGIAAVVVVDRSGDLNMRSALLHLISDALASGGVAMTGLVMFVTGGWHWLDPVSALLISVLIGWHGWRLARAAVDILLESTPAGLRPTAIAEVIASTDGVEAVHDMHTWALSSELLALSAHVVVAGDPNLEQAQVVANRVKERLAREFGIAHATLELESEQCPPDSCCEAEAVTP